MNTTTSSIKTMDDLHQRQAFLQKSMDRQKEEMISQVNKIRANLQPIKLIKDTAEELFDGSEQSSSLMKTGVDYGVSTFASHFVRDPRTAFIVKWLLPTALKMSPKLANWVGEKTPDHIQLLQMAHTAIVKTRKRLNK